MEQLTRFIETMKLFDIESVFVGLGLMQVNNFDSSHLFTSPYRDILSYNFIPFNLVPTSCQSSRLLIPTAFIHSLHSPRLVSSRWIFVHLKEKHRMPCFTL